jgi:hypothetical protein
LGNFLMIGNRQRSEMPLAHQNHVAATLTNLQPPECFKHLDRFAAADARQLGHQAITST